MWCLVPGVRTCGSGAATAAAASAARRLLPLQGEGAWRCIASDSAPQTADADAQSPNTNSGDRSGTRGGGGRRRGTGRRPGPAAASAGRGDTQHRSGSSTGSRSAAAWSDDDLGPSNSSHSSSGWGELGPSSSSNSSSRSSRGAARGRRRDDARETAPRGRGGDSSFDDWGRPGMNGPRSSRGGSRGTRDRDRWEAEWREPPRRRPHPLQLSALIRAAEEPRDLEETIRRHGRDFNHLHILTALSRAARLAAATPGVTPAPAGPRDAAAAATAASVATPGAGGAADLGAEQLRAVAASLAVPLQQTLGSCTAGDIARAVWAFARVGVCPPPAVLDAIESELLGWGKLADADAQQLAALAWGLVRLGRREPRLFEAIAGAAAQRVGAAGGRELSQLAWAMAKAGHRSDDLFAAISARVREALAGSSSSEQEQAVGELPASSGVTNLESRRDSGAADEGEEEEQDGRGAKRRRPRLPRRAFVGDPSGLVLTTQGLANIAWAHAALGVRDEALLQAIASVASSPPLLYEARAEEAASILWALASLGLAPAAPGAADALATAALRRPRECGAAEVANLMWSLAGLQQLAAARDRGLGSPAGSPPQLQPPTELQQTAEKAPAVGGTLLGTTSGGSGAGPTFVALSRALLQCLSSANSADVSQALWALAAARHFDAPVLDALCAAAGALASTGLMAAPEIATCAWALARLGYREEGVLRVLGDEAAGLAAGGALSGPDIANLSWAFAVLEVPHPQLLGELAACAARSASRMDDHALSITAWALARAGASDADLMGTLLAASGARAARMSARDLACSCQAAALLPPGDLPHAQATELLSAAAVRATALASSSGADGSGTDLAVLQKLVAAVGRAAWRHGVGDQIETQLTAARGATAVLQERYGSGGGALLGDPYAGGEQEPAPEPQQALLGAAQQH